MIKVLWSPKFYFVLWGGGLAGSRCFEFLCELFVEVQPRRASGLAVCCSCGNKRGTRESKELVGVAAPSDPVWSILVKILHSVEGGDVEQVCSNLEKNFPCLRLLSLYLLLVFISCMLILSLSFMRDIPCAILIHAWDCLLTLVFNQESHSGTSTLI